STTQNLSSLCAGNYAVTVRDDNSCQVAANVTITEPTVLSATLTGTNLTCNAVCAGQAATTPSGGTAGYTYSWNNGSTTQNLSSLCAGGYTVTVRDVNSCQTTASVTITEPTVLSATLTGTNLTCNTQCTGQAANTPSGGTAGYTYSWSNGSTTQNLSSLCAGNYTVTVRDANSCQVTASVTITEPTVLSVTLNGINLLCNTQCTGQAASTPSGGTSPYSYSWNNGSTTQNLSSLCAGNYAVTVMDANSCQVAGNVTITEPTVLSATLTGTNLACNAVCAGQAATTPSGGTSPYSYSWSNSSTSQNLSSLCAGSYTVTVRDANSCQTTGSVTITEPTVLSVSLTGTNLTCNAACEGQVTSTPSGGTITYSYSWSNSATTQNLSSLCAGTYTLTLSDANGCKAGAQVSLSEPTVLVVNSGGTDATCGNTDGTACATGQDGTPGYNYNWSTGATSQCIASLASGGYTVTVTDNNGCVQTAVLAINDAGGPSAGISTQTNASCNSGNDGSVAVTTNGGTPPITYSWSTGSTATSISSLSAGSYVLTVTDGNNCNTIVNATITEPTAVSITTTTTNVSCNGGADGSASATGQNGTPGYTYSWNTGATTQTISNLSAGNYTVTVTDNNSCKANTTVSITEPSALSVSLSGTNLLCNTQCTGQVSATSSGGTASYSYSWNTGATTQNLTGLCAGTYTVTATDNNGCKAGSQITLTEPTVLTLTTTTSNVGCNSGNDGSASATGQNGTPGYTYSWSNGQTSQAATSLTAGNYGVTVTDANGCQANATVSITEP
ncbi:SprB repeat-containing protein, partial [Sphingobacteriaceae bacterium AH-315-L07]|nr:SprB repeat-containing protein [Sphingobacteriaceae bacterium AH-315-L07]